MGCATGLVKAIMFVFNFICVVAGLALIVGGTLFYLQYNTYENILGTAFAVAPTLALILGIIVFLIAFFGCCGVVKESYCMLLTYAIILLLLFIVQIGLGVYVYTQANKGENEGDFKPLITKNLDKALSNYNTNQESREVINFLQKNVHCCGVRGPQDYLTVWTNSSVPASCCRIYDGTPCNLASGALAFVGQTPTYYTTGCSDKLTQEITSHMNYVVYVFIAAAIVELIGSIFAFCLASSVKNEDRRRYP